MLKQKIVLEVGKMYCSKCQKKCRKIAAVQDGFISMAIEAEKNYLVITGVGIDTASLAKSLRKEVGPTVIVSIEVLKTPAEKKEGGIKKQAKELQEEEAKKKKTLTWSYMGGHCDNYYNYNYNYAYHPPPPGCEMVCYCAPSCYPNTWFTW